MQDYQKTVLKLLSASIFNAPINLTGTNDWSSVFEECRKQTVIALAAQLIPRDAGNIQSWDKNVMKTTSRFMKLEYAHCELHELLTANNIAYVTMKGSTSAQFYPVPMLRQMGDVDFLVDKAEVNYTRELLIQNGYSQVEYQNLHHLEFTKNGIVYELHHQVNGLPSGKQQEVIEQYLKDMTAKGVKFESSYGSFMVPNQFHHGLILLLHTAKHMTTSGLGLRHLCDWAVFVNQVPDFEALFKRPLQEMGLWRFATQITDVCCRYLELPRQPWMIIWPDSLSEAIIEDIMSAGNFGSGKEQTKDFWLINHNAKENPNMLLQLVRTANRVTLQNWRWVKYCKVLLPIGWIYFGLKYILSVLTGRQKGINVPQMISSASKRRKLYRLFRLYDPEL